MDCRTKPAGSAAWLGYATCHEGTSAATAMSYLFGILSAAWWMLFYFRSLIYSVAHQANHADWNQHRLQRKKGKVRFNQGSLGSDLRTMRIDFSEELDIYLTTTTTAARGITTAAVGAEDEEGFFAPSQPLQTYVGGGECVKVTLWLSSSFERGRQ